MKITYLQKFSLQDYPNKIACIIFLHGCNFRCGFCHNPELVKEDTLLGEDENKILGFLEEKKGRLEGVVITGGEPLIDRKIINFLEMIKNKGYKIKLDTNGSNPKILKEIIDKKLVDYVAMDIKTSKGKYKEAVGLDLDLSKIEKSIKMISKLEDYEFRTTAVPKIVDVEDISKIKTWLEKLTGKSKLRAYYIQQFNNRNKLVDNKFRDVEPYKREKLEEMKKIIENNFEICEIRA